MAAIDLRAFDAALVNCEIVSTRPVKPSEQARTVDKLSYGPSRRALAFVSPPCVVDWPELTGDGNFGTMYGPTDVDKAAYTAGVTDKELPIEGAPLAQMDAYFGALRAIDDQRVETVHARQKELLNTRGLSKEEVRGKLSPAVKPKYEDDTLAHTRLNMSTRTFTWAGSERVVPLVDARREPVDEIRHEDVCAIATQLDRVYTGLPGSMFGTKWNVCGVMLLKRAEQRPQPGSDAFASYGVPAWADTFDSTGLYVPDERERAAALAAVAGLRTARAPAGPGGRELARAQGYRRAERAASAAAARAAMAEGGQQCALHGAVVKSALRGVGNRLHLCDAPGGTGKTFVERAIIAAVRADGHAVVVGASSGVAATLLPDGRTFHLTFKTRCHLDSPDRCLRDVTGVDERFGGETLLLAGDFRQCLPVVRRGSRAQIVRSCLKYSAPWQHDRQHALVENVRASSAARDTGDALGAGEWAELLRSPGDGAVPAAVPAAGAMPGAFPLDPVQLPEAVGGVPIRVGSAYPTELVTTLSTARRVGPTTARCATARCSAPSRRTWRGSTGWRSAASRARRRGARRRTSWRDDGAGKQIARASVEFLDSLEHAQMPHRVLDLKPGMVVMLPRNLSPGEGLCGGTRLIVRGVRAGGRLLECARPGAAAGRDSTVLVARVDHHSPDDGTFALLHVAASRVGHTSRVRFALGPDLVTRSVVFKEVLRAVSGGEAAAAALAAAAVAAARECAAAARGGGGRGRRARRRRRAARWRRARRRRAGGANAAGAQGPHAGALPAAAWVAAARVPSALPPPGVALAPQPQPPPPPSPPPAACRQAGQVRSGGDGALESRLARGRPSARNSARMARARRGALSKFYVVGRQPVEDAFDGPMWPVRVPGVPRGAKNEGSACYTTVLMQSLFALNMLRAMLRSASRRANSVERARFRDFGTLIEDTRAPTRLCLVSVIDVISGRGARRTPQDAAEFFRLLLGRVPGLAAAFEADTRVGPVLEQIAVPSEAGEGIAVLVSVGGDAARALAHALGGAAGPPRDRHTNAGHSGVLTPASIAVEAPRTTRGNGSQCKNNRALVCAPRLLLGGRDHLPVAGVVHVGEGPMSGHLVAIVLRNEAWFPCDDYNIYNVPESDALAWASGASMLVHSRVDVEPLDPALGSASPPSAASPAWPSSEPDAPTLPAAWPRVRQMAAVPTDATIGIAGTAADISTAAIGPAACEARQVVSVTRALPTAAEPCLDGSSAHLVDGDAVGEHGRSNVTSGAHVHVR
ncbi:hypothetical protein KFE25_009705 [Diacronema lutheri]|uniref:ATP-dependent DNA helicase n=1 Tax=Diacronema lutheri TaxID=2081491 RepID=A0A8J5XV85_DIALT|nr:hypothetical protein KFE25_009705 [Diacronema lutheri]